MLVYKAVFLSGVVAVENIVKKVFAAQQRPQAVRQIIGTRRNVTGNTHFIIKLHDRRRHRALETVNARHPPKHRGIVHRFIKIAADVLEVVDVNGIPRVENVLFNIGRAGTADSAYADNQQRSGHGNGHGCANHNDAEKPLVPKLFVNQHKRQQANHCRQGVKPKGLIVALNTDAEIFGAVVVFRHMRHHTD